MTVKLAQSHFFSFKIIFSSGSLFSNPKIKKKTFHLSNKSPNKLKKLISSSYNTGSLKALLCSSVHESTLKDEDSNTGKCLILQKQKGEAFSRLFYL